MDCAFPLRMHFENAPFEVHFPEWNLDFQSLKRENSQLSPKTSFHWTTGNSSETVVVRLKQWSLYVTTVP